METFRLQDAKRIDVLASRFGEDVTLDGESEELIFRILAEFEIHGRMYAVLQSDQQAKEDDFSVFRIVMDGSGEPELESIEDDEEWENAAELYDEMMVAEEEA